MRHSLARSAAGLLALLSFASVALAQGSKLPGRHVTAPDASARNRISLTSTSSGWLIGANENPADNKARC